MVDPSVIAQWRDGSAPRIISELMDLVLLLEQYSPATLRKGAHEKVGRTFFLIRLAEAFSLLTGHEPANVLLGRIRSERAKMPAGRRGRRAATAEPA
jgi:hypothetical protein